MFGLLWFMCGLVAAYLMYKDKEQIPIFWAIVVVFFGLLSLIVWMLGNLNTTIPNPRFNQKKKK